VDFILLYQPVDGICRFDLVTLCVNQKEFHIFSEHLGLNFVGSLHARILHLTIGSDGTGHRKVSTNFKSIFLGNCYRRNCKSKD
jgi:hypothetical protein